MPRLTRANINTPVGFNQAVAKSAIADAVRWLEGGDAAAVVARLKVVEQTLASAKPAM
jgi:hypothetical protein